MNINCLRGVVVASPTPFDARNKVDEAATRHLIAYYKDSQIDGVFLLSSTGEYFAMTPDARELFVDTAIEENNSVLPLLVSVSDASLEMVLRNIDIYGNKNIDAVVLLPPYFYKYDQDELYTFFSKAADRSPVPLILYNQPTRLPSTIDLSLIDALSNHKNIVGIKDTGSDAVRLLELLTMFDDREDFLVYTGSEGFAGYASVFGGNYVYALAAVAPQLFVDIYHSGKNGDLSSVKKLQSQINQLTGLFKVVRGGSGESFSNFIYGIKAALKLKGICEIHSSQFGYELTNVEWNKVKELL